jgi:hypothetical protein
VQLTLQHLYLVDCADYCYILAILLEGKGYSTIVSKKLAAKTNLRTNLLPTIVTNLKAIAHVVSLAYIS